MEKLSEKPKFRKNWKNWQEDASRVKDKKTYGKKIDKIFGHRCEKCGGERINGSFYHMVGCPDHPDAKQKRLIYGCDACNDTGYYGDNGPGIAGNGEWHECDECTVSDRCRRTHVQNCANCEDFSCGDNTNAKPETQEETQSNHKFNPRPGVRL